MKPGEKGFYRKVINKKKLGKWRGRILWSDAFEKNRIKIRKEYATFDYFIYIYFKKGEYVPPAQFWN